MIPNYPLLLENFPKIGYTKCECST